MKIGVLGSGAVGQTLANGFIRYGNRVMIGTRSPEKLAPWKKNAGEQGTVGSFSEAAAFGDILVLAVKGTAALNALTTTGAENLAGKTIIDATNPIADAPPRDGVLSFFTSHESSLMEQFQAAFPTANFVKAFKSVGNALMINPDFGGIKPSMFICGDSEDAKAEVAKIIDLFGYSVEDMGSAVAARAIEPLCILWCIPGFRDNEWTNHAFKLLKT